MARITGSNVRFVFMDPSNEVMAVSRWLQVIAPLLGISDITLRRKFQLPDGKIRSKIEYNGYIVYRCLEHKTKEKKGNVFLNGPEVKLGQVKRSFTFHVKKPKKKKY